MRLSAVGIEVDAASRVEAQGLDVLPLDAVRIYGVAEHTRSERPFETELVTDETVWLVGRRHCLCDDGGRFVVWTARTVSRCYARIEHRVAIEVVAGSAEIRGLGECRGSLLWSTHRAAKDVVGLRVLLGYAVVAHSALQIEGAAEMISKVAIQRMLA